MTEWRIYKNDHSLAREPVDWAVAAPPWRRRGFREPADRRFVAEDPPGNFAADDGFYYLTTGKVIDTVNAALRLWRPILVTGAPGTGKSSLAESIARELGLGPVLTWLITSRSTLKEGLYDYDALGRLNDMNLVDSAARKNGDPAELRSAADDIGRYITLGPLGDALLPRPRPRVLLIDEIDKSDVDLPGDLLHVLERGCFKIPELIRERRKEVRVQREDAPPVSVQDGTVQGYQFPLIVLTSNEERDFPPAFKRRCLSVQLELPDPADLVKIAAHKLREPGEPAAGIAADGGLAAGATPDWAQELIGEFVRERGKDGRALATDQLLNALYLRMSGRGLTDTVREVVLARLTGTP